MDAFIITAVSIQQCFTNDVSHTVAAPETSPPPTSPAPPGPPERGNFNITNSTGAVCLLARMGLQLNISFISSSHGKVLANLKLILPKMVTKMNQNFLRASQVAVVRLEFTCFSSSKIESR